MSSAGEADGFDGPCNASRRGCDSKEKMVPVEVYRTGARCEVAPTLDDSRDQLQEGLRVVGRVCAMIVSIMREP